MSHRLQHLQRKRTDQNDQDTPQKEAYQETSGTAKQMHSSSHKAESTNTTNTRPLFAPTSNFYPYTKNDYKKGQKPFPPPESLYLPKDTEVDPCFLRTTTMALYSQPRKSSLPIAVWITPFASDRVSVVTVNAPLRCSGCKAYVNPYFQFDGTRRSAMCNLCGLRFPISQNIDKNNLQSAEIATQSVVDFRVSDKIYFKRRTDIIKIMAVVELSMNTLELGIFQTVLSSLSNVFEGHQFQQNVRVGIVFYSDQGVGYLQKGGQGQHPNIFLVPNNKNNISCCPLSDEEMLFDPNQQREGLLQSISYLQEYGNSFWKLGRFSHTANYIFAIKSIKESFSNQTGKVLLFSCLDPRWGSCAVRGREGEQQKLPLKPLHLQIYELGKELARMRIGVEHFYFSKDHLINHELETTHFLSSLTGGELHLYSGFNKISSDRLYYRIFHSLTRPTVFDGDFTCRVSPGLSVLRYGVPEGLRDGRDISLSTLNSGSSFMAELQQQEKIEESQGAFVQFALLYTTGKGQRRIRVINFRFDITSRLQILYDSIDYLTFANYIARTYAHRLLKTDRVRSREDAINCLATIISEFQGRCQSALSAKIDNLVMPQGLAWALHYLHPVFSGRLFFNQQKYTADSIVKDYLQLQASSPYYFASHYYPRLYPLTLDIYDSQPLPGDFLQSNNEDQRIAILPWTLPLKKESMDAGVYLYDDCDQLVMLVQHQSGEELLQELFGTTNWESLEADGFPELETSHNIRVNNIVSEIRRRNTQQGCTYQPLIVKTPLLKKQYTNFVASMLKEDCPDYPFSHFIQQIKGKVAPAK